MTQPANTIHLIDFDAMDGAEICRDERCELVGVHVVGKHCVRARLREGHYRTRSRKHAGQPWRAYNYDALHESVYNAVSMVEARPFSSILSTVENDYGTVCDRSVHRHLSTWRRSGEIVRMDFRGRIHAYLRAGSRLIADPELVLEQMLDLHSESMMWDEYKPKGRQGSCLTEAVYASA